MTQISDGQRSNTSGQAQSQAPYGSVPLWTPPQGQAPHRGPVPGQPQYGQPLHWGPQLPTGWQQPSGTPYPFPMPQPYSVPAQQPVARPINTTAIFALIMSVLWIFGVGSVLGVIFGIISVKEHDRTGEAGDGLAVAAIVVGCIGFFAGLIFIGAANS